jgi:hypothetical protein
MKLADCSGCRLPGALFGAQAPAGTHCERVTRLGVALAAILSAQSVFSRNTFGRSDRLAGFALSRLPPHLQEACLALPIAKGLALLPTLATSLARRPSQDRLARRLPPPAARGRPRMTTTMRRTTRDRRPVS